MHCALSICLKGLVVLCLHDVLYSWPPCALRKNGFQQITACENAMSFSIWSRAAQDSCGLSLHSLLDSICYEVCRGCFAYRCSIYHIVWSDSLLFSMCRLHSRRQKQLLFAWMLEAPGSLKPDDSSAELATTQIETLYLVS